jgi:threonine dehydrogenase-like Zn-dependent dehydrogenase
MPHKLAEYRRANAPLPKTNRLWPLYGAGLENLGRHGQPLDLPLPEIGPDHLLVRHDAVGLCFSDIKVIRLGEDHPRIHHNMQAQPVTLGHEVSMTVVGVGDDLRDQVQVGDRFIVQPDIVFEGVGRAYGYEIQGGLSHYNLIDQRVLKGDYGNYLIPVQPETGYAEAALIEPWSCVLAAYQLQYRRTLKAGGTTWIIGTRGARDDYLLSAGFDAQAHPARLLLTGVPDRFAERLQQQAIALDIELLPAPHPSNPPTHPVDDIILLGADADLIETVSPHLADFGVLAVVAEVPPPRKVSVDAGRIHYNRWLYVGTSGPDISAAYGHLPVRSHLRPGGRAWFVGAGGPMGRMHVQRAIQSHDSPRLIVCTDISEPRLDDLSFSFAAEAQRKGIEWFCLNPLDQEAYEASMTPFRETGFDDIMVLAPMPSLISDAATYLAPRGVLNIFAGVARGTMIQLDLSDLYLRDTRIIGHSASTIDDLRLMLQQAESGQLLPNRSVAAIGSLSAARDGLQAVDDARFPGKVVIYPHIKEMPLTALPDLKHVLPTVSARLRGGREWTLEAEREFLRRMLP